jgi:hypothetical protein
LNGIINTMQTIGGGIAQDFWAVEQWQLFLNILGERLSTDNLVENVSSMIGLNRKQSLMFFQLKCSKLSLSFDRQLSDPFLYTAWVESSSRTFFADWLNCHYGSSAALNILRTSRGNSTPDETAVTVATTEGITRASGGFAPVTSPDSFYQLRETSLWQDWVTSQWSCAYCSYCH